MNKASASPKPRRSYDNTLRAEHAQRTRERILEAAVQILSDPSRSGATMVDVARAAGVSEPTLYRHFGSKARLYEELDDHAQSHLGMPPFTAELDELPRHVVSLYRRFHENDALLRASLRTSFGNEMRRRGKARRFERLRDTMAKDTDHLDENEARAVAALVRVIIGFETFQRFVDELGVGPEEAANASSWAVETLTRRLREDRAVGRTSLRAEGEDEGGDR